MAQRVTTATSGSRRRRARRGSITRDQVVEAAVRAISVSGYEELTIRSLAADLEVAPMSLYRYVRDKDDLLDAVVDRLLARRWRPRSNPDDWMGWTREAAQRFRDFLITQPAALRVYLSHPVVAPVAVARMEAVLEVLRSAGFEYDHARRAYGTIHTYTIGFAALEASRSRSARSGAVEGALAAELATFTTPAQFSDGLGFLLDGIERQRLAYAKR